MKRRLFVLAVAVLVLAFSLSCRNSGDEVRTRLEIHIEQDSSRTIMPSQTLMETRKYSVSGTGPDNVSFGPLLSTDSELSVTDLVPGIWTIIAKALNAENNELASGSGRCEISSGTNRATVVLDTITGTGTLELNFKWNRDICDDDRISINISLEDNEGNVVSRNKDVMTSELQTSVVVSLDAGSHVLGVQVSDSRGNLGVGATDAVRIVSNTRSASLLISSWLIRFVPARTVTVVTSLVTLPSASLAT